MKYLTRTEMTPTPSSPDWDFLIKWISGCITFFSAFAVYINRSFKAKREERLEALEAQKTERKEFIEKVVLSIMNLTLDGIMKDVRSDIQTLFKFREEDRKNVDGKLMDIMKELKK